MTHSSPTPSLPTRSSEPRALLVALLAGLLHAGTAQAHGDGDGIPESTGYRAGASVALAHVQGSEPAPIATLPGVLLLGQSAEDRRQTALEHGVLDLGWRLNPHLGATLAVAWHGKDPVHTEAALLEARHGATSLSLGRTRVPLGQTILRAGHLDHFALMPLAKRAAFNGDWLDQGANLRWQNPHEDAAWSVQELNLGLWRGRAFPGSRSGGPLAPALHAQFGGHDWTLDASVAHFAPAQRAAALQSLQAGHSHNAPTCSDSLKGVVCFDGRSTVAASSLRWTPSAMPQLSLSAAGMWRSESGQLYSRDGDGHYTGQTRGWWADALWRFQPAWLAGVRAEGLDARQTLQGVGASLLAVQSGLSPNRPVQRQAVTLGWTVHTGLVLSGEVGQESSTDEAKGRATFTALRLVWTPPDFVSSP